MAVTADQVVVELIARVEKYERDLARAERTSSRSFGSIGRSAQGASQAIGLVRSVMAGLGAAISVKAVVDLTSAWSDLTSRVDLAAGSMERGGAVMERLQQIARRTYSGLNQTAESWLQNSTALRELGFSTQQQLDLTEALNNALVISGAKAQVAASVMDAWSKAMALGELRGDNLNTVIQRGGRLAEALAQSMGVSTNELRRLGQEGKITTVEMFGVTEQLEQLRQEADDMPVTVADGFQALSDAIFVFVGNADQASGAGEAVGSALKDLAEAINNIPEDWFDRVFGGVGGFISGEIEAFQNDIGTLKEEIEGIGRVFQYLRDTKLTDVIGDAIDHLSGESSLRLQRSIADVEQEFTSLLTSIEAGAEGVGDPLAEELGKIRESLIRDQESAEDAKDAITGLIVRYPDSSGLLGELLRIAEALAEVRGEADAAGAAISNLDTARAEQAVIRGLKPYIDIDLDDDGGPIKPPSTSSKSSGKSPLDQFNEALAAQERRNEELRRETALRATLNPLVNDYGYAVEKLRVQMDLENAAARAGLALTPERRAAIEALAETYAQASVAAEQLDESQSNLRASAEAWASTVEDATRGFINDLLEGKDAAEAFSNVLKNVASQLINMGLSNIFGSGGLNLAGIFGGVSTRATGGPVYAGNPTLVGEKGPEIFIPSGPGKIVPNSQVGGGATVTYAPVIDARGADMAVVARLEAQQRQLLAEFEPRVKSIVRGANHNWRVRR